jgi:hypothetical protein
MVVALILMEGVGSEVLVGMLAGGSRSAPWTNPKPRTQDLFLCFTLKLLGSAGAATVMLPGDVLVLPEGAIQSGYVLQARIAPRQVVLWTPFFTVLAPVYLSYDGFMGRSN